MLLAGAKLALYAVPLEAYPPPLRAVAGIEVPIIVLCTLSFHPEIRTWVRQALGRGIYRHEQVPLVALRFALLALLCYAAAFAMAVVHSELLSWLDDGGPAVSRVFRNDYMWTLQLVLVTASEELFYRIALFGALLRRLDSPWAAALISAGVFGGFHLWHGLDHAIYATVMGLVYVGLYHRARSIWPSLFGHLLTNADALS